MNKAKIIKIVGILLIAASVTALLVIAGNQNYEMPGASRDCDDESGMSSAYKPIIYIYPTRETNVTVSYPQYKRFDVSYPEYKGLWSVIAKPDGTLVDANGRQYYALYWEHTDKLNLNFDEGFIVEGKNTATFLEEKLEILGLNEKERNEFIIYWLPRMQNNKYNLISFQGDNYFNQFEMSVDPKPDIMIRVFMAYKPLKEKVDIKEQKLEPIQRSGYTVVEWGGTEVK